MISHICLYLDHKKVCVCENIIKHHHTPFSKLCYERGMILIIDRLDLNSYRKASKHFLGKTPTSMLTIIPFFYIGVSKRVNISTDFSVNLNFRVENKSRKVQLQVDSRSLKYKLFTSEVNVLSLEAYGGLVFVIARKCAQLTASSGSSHKLVSDS